MGIRIHKVIGYGLTNIVADTESWSVKDDPRFNPDGYMFDHQEDFDLVGFVEYLDKLLTSMDEDHDDYFDLTLLKRRIERNELTDEPYRSIIYDMEFGEKEVMVCVPPTAIKLWQRYDDMIDYYDPVNQNAEHGCENSVIELDRALFPWESYVNTKTMPPKRLTGLELQLFYIIRNLGFEGITESEQVLQKIGINNKEDLEKYIVPMIPCELVELLKYVKMFKNDDDIYTLRPLIYGYWG